MVSLRAWYHYYAWLAYQTEGRTIPQDRASITVYTQRIPFGVVGVIPAFNSPMLLGGMGLAPALAAGNTVVVKPPEVNSLSLLRLGELPKEAGLPDGCLNIVTGYGHEAGDALVAHPLVRKVWFTGGPDSARFVAARAAEHLEAAGARAGRQERQHLLRRRAGGRRRQRRHRGHLRGRRPDVRRRLAAARARAHRRRARREGRRTRAHGQARGPHLRGHRDGPDVAGEDPGRRAQPRAGGGRRGGEHRRRRRRGRSSRPRVVLRAHGAGQRHATTCRSRRTSCSGPCCP